MVNLGHSESRNDSLVYYQKDRGGNKDGER